MPKRILTLEDLVKFCSENNFSKFDASENGYILTVKSPATFELNEEADDSHRGMLRLQYKLLQIGTNLNKSRITMEAANDAAATIKNRPILGAIHSFDDGTEDFSSHEIEIVEDENGEATVNYIEKQIGSLSEEDPFYTYDANTQQTWLCSYGYVPETYTHAADIIRSKNGTATSVELAVEKMSYDAKEKILNLDKFYVSGVTHLGRDPQTGREIKPGMENARADIADFSQENNGIMDKIESGSPVSIDEISKKGGETPMKFEELLEKYGKTAEDVTFDYAEMSDEELENAFAEAFAESADEIEPEAEVGAVAEVDMEDEKVEEPDAAEEKFTKVFELSHNDVRVALYELLQSVEESDNTWYYINEVYDDHFIYSDFGETKYWDQKYVKDGDTVAFEGEREERFAMMLSASEKSQVESMRANYTDMAEKLAKYEAEPDKMAVLTSEDYSQVADSEEFAALVNDHFDLSVEEVRAKADGILLEYAKTHSIKFSEENGSVGHKTFQNAPWKKASRYGDLFSRNK